MPRICAKGCFHFIIRESRNLRKDGSCMRRAVLLAVVLLCVRALFPAGLRAAPRSPRRRSPMPRAGGVPCRPLGGGRRLARRVRAAESPGGSAALLAGARPAAPRPLPGSRRRDRGEPRGAAPAGRRARSPAGRPRSGPPGAGRRAAHPRAPRRAPPRPADRRPRRLGGGRGIGARVRFEPQPVVGGPGAAPAGRHAGRADPRRGGGPLARPALSLALYPFHDRPGPSLGVTLDARRSFHQDFGFLDLGESHGAVQLAFGSDPRGFLEGPLGAARVPFGGGGPLHRAAPGRRLDLSAGRRPLSAHLGGGRLRSPFTSADATATRLDLGLRRPRFRAGPAGRRAARSGKDVSMQA